jgi:Sec63 Brl domain
LEVWEAIPRLAVEETRLSNKLRVRVRRLNRRYKDKSFIYAPKFTKQQQESWFVLALDSSGQKLLALQRVGLSGRGNGEGNTELTIPPELAGDSLVLKVVSDGWRGVDVEKSVAWKSDEVVEVKSQDTS